MTEMPNPPAHTDAREASHYFSASQSRAGGWERWASQRTYRMLSATCHCGAVRIEVPQRPQKLTICNCSICRRYGALWAYYKAGTVRVTGHPENTTEYVWGDKTLRTIRCRTCGCVTHWEPLQPKPNSRLAVNARNFDPSALGSVRIRRFDGADTWKYLD